MDIDVPRVYLFSAAKSIDNGPGLSKGERSTSNARDEIVLERLECSPC